MSSEKNRTTLQEETRVLEKHVLLLLFSKDRRELWTNGAVGCGVGWGGWRKSTASVGHLGMGPTMPFL